MLLKIDQLQDFAAKINQKEWKNQNKILNECPYEPTTTLSQFSNKVVWI